MTSRGSAVERSTLEELKSAVPKSLVDMIVMVKEAWFGGDCNVELWIVESEGSRRIAVGVCRNPVTDKAI